MVFAAKGSKTIHSASLSLFLSGSFGTTSVCFILVTYAIVQLSEPVDVLLHFWKFSGLKKVGASAANVLEVCVFKVPQSQAVEQMSLSVCASIHQADQSFSIESRGKQCARRSLSALITSSYCQSSNGQPKYLTQSFLT